MFLFFKQKTAYELRSSDWSSDVCSSDLFDPTKAQAGGVTIHLLWGDRCELVPHIVFDGGNILFLWQRSSKVDQLGLSDYHFLRVCHSCLEGEDQCSRSKQKSFHRPRARKRCLICLFASRPLQTACSA